MLATKPLLANSDNDGCLSPFHLLCALLADRTQPRGLSSEIAARLADPAVVESVVNLAAQEQIIPALYDAVGDHLKDIIPKQYRIAMAIQHEANRKRNAVIAAALQEMGAGFRAAGLKAATLKGASWIVEDGSGNAPWRWMVDIDIAVERRRMAAATDVLARVGFQRYLDPNYSAKRTRNNFHFQFRRDDFPLELEIHRDIGWRCELLPVATLFESARATEFGLVLPVPWCRAFHAIIHWQIQDQGFSRHLLRLKDVVEVSRFARRADVDWDALFMHAESVGARGACEAALATSARLLNTDCPALPATPGGRAWCERAIAVRQSPERTWRATQRWRMSTLWNCDKIAYRLTLRDRSPLRIQTAVWIGRIVRFPVLAVRAVGFATRCITRVFRMARHRRSIKLSGTGAISE